jgi:hypothetical protein
MPKFSSFILAESLTDKHVTALHRFNELFKAHVSADLVKQLLITWKQQCSKAPKVPKAKAEEALLSNPKVQTKVELTTNMVKLAATTEQGKNREVHTSVKLPLLLPSTEREVCISDLLDGAQQTFASLLDEWTDAFNIEHQGKLSSEFRVRRSKHNVRLSLITDNNGVEHETVIYYVAVEHGKPSNKARSYDLVFLSLS